MTNYSAEFYAGMRSTALVRGRQGLQSHLWRRPPFAVVADSADGSIVIRSKKRRQAPDCFSTSSCARRGSPPAVDVLIPAPWPQGHDRGAHSPSCERVRSGVLARRAACQRQGTAPMAETKFVVAPAAAGNPCSLPSDRTACATWRAQHGAILACVWVACCMTWLNPRS